MEVKNVIIQETMQINGLYFLAKENYCFEELVHLSSTDACVNKDNVDPNNLYYKIIKNNTICYLPEISCVKTPCSVNPLFHGMGHEYYSNKFQDQTTDYFFTVKREMGIDIKQSYKPQHNGKDITKIVHVTKKSRWDDNRFLPDSNTKDYDKTGCECPIDDQRLEDIIAPPPPTPEVPPEPIIETIDILYNYGNLYNWYAVNTGKLAPTGWSVPSEVNWQTLSTYLGGDSISGGKLKSLRVEPDIHPRWTTPNVGATNEFNFNMIPGGYRNAIGIFDDFGNNAYIWTSVTNQSINIFYNQDYINFASWWNNSHGFVIRCLKDTPTTEDLAKADGEYCDPIQDADGNWYPTVKIGTQVWMAQNLKTTKYNDGSGIPEIQDNSAWLADTAGAYCTYNNLPLSTYEDEDYYYTITIEH